MEAEDEEDEEEDDDDAAVVVAVISLVPPATLCPIAAGCLQYMLISLLRTNNLIACARTIASNVGVVDRAARASYPPSAGRSDRTKLSSRRRTYSPFSSASNADAIERPSKPDDATNVINDDRIDGKSRTTRGDDDEDDGG